MAVGAPEEGWFDLAASARRFGHYAWTERRLFETLGRWIPTVREPAAKVLLGRHCAHHAWHAALCAERLPVLPEQPPEDLILPPNGAVVEFFDELAGPPEPVSTVERLAGVYRVLLPHALAGYRGHLERVDRDVDAPTTRVLTLIIADEEDDRRDGEALIRALEASDELRERIAARQAHVEELLARAGGIAGADPIAMTDPAGGTGPNQPT